MALGTTARAQSKSLVLTAMIFAAIPQFIRADFASAIQDVIYGMDNQSVRYGPYRNSTSGRSA